MHHLLKGAKKAAAQKVKTTTPNSGTTEDSSSDDQDQVTCESPTDIQDVRTQESTERTSQELSRSSDLRCSARGSSNRPDRDHEPECPSKRLKLQSDSSVIEAATSQVAKQHDLLNHDFESHIKSIQRASREHLECMRQATNLMKSKESEQNFEIARLTHLIDDKRTQMCHFRDEIAKMEAESSKIEANSRAKVENELRAQIEALQQQLGQSKRQAEEVVTLKNSNAALTRKLDALKEILYPCQPLVGVDGSLAEVAKGS